MAVIGWNVRLLAAKILLARSDWAIKQINDPAQDQLVTGETITRKENFA